MINIVKLLIAVTLVTLAANSSKGEKTAEIDLRFIHEMSTTMYNCEKAGTCDFPTFEF